MASNCAASVDVRTATLKLNPMKTNLARIISLMMVGLPLVAVGKSPIKKPPPKPVKVRHAVEAVPPGYKLVYKQDFDGNEAKVKEELDAERVRAESNIQRERDAAIEELRKEFAGLAITAAEKVVKTSLDEEGHRALIEGGLNDEGSRNN